MSWIPASSESEARHLLCGAHAHTQLTVTRTDALSDTDPHTPTHMQRHTQAATHSPGEGGKGRRYPPSGGPTGPRSSPGAGCGIRGSAVADMIPHLSSRQCVWVVFLLMSPPPCPRGFPTFPFQDIFCSVENVNLCFQQRRILRISQCGTLGDPSDEQDPPWAPQDFGFR